jgi:hypothetical protein
MSDTVIKVENLSKQYRLGEISTGTLSRDIQAWMHRKLGKENTHTPVIGSAGVSQNAEKLKTEKAEKENAEKLKTEKISTSQDSSISAFSSSLSTFQPSSISTFSSPPFQPFNLSTFQLFLPTSSGPSATSTSKSNRASCWGSSDTTGRGKARC